MRGARQVAVKENWRQPRLALSPQQARRQIGAALLAALLVLPTVVYVFIGLWKADLEDLESSHNVAGSRRALRDKMISAGGGGGGGEEEEAGAGEGILIEQVGADRIRADRGGVGMVATEGHGDNPLLMPYSFARLYDGKTIPWIGFGTAGLGDLTSQSVMWALEAGYKMIDSAEARDWYSEDLVGDALKQSSNISRSSLFITTKVHPRNFREGKTLESVKRSLSDLKTNYLDLVLLHYPGCWGTLCSQDESGGTWQQAWRELERLYAAGVIRALGVSNFFVPDLEQLLSFAKVKPHVVQTHADPLGSSKDVRDFCKAHNIVFTSYSTLGTQWPRKDGKNPVLSHNVVMEIAEEVGKSTTQVVLRWALQHQMVVIPRSSNKQHIADNLLLDFVLSPAQMARIDAMEGTAVS